MDSFFEAINNGAYENALLIANNVSDISLQKQLLNHIGIIKDGRFSNEIEAPYIGDQQKEAYLINLINKGLKIYARDGNEIEGFETLRLALDLSERNKNLSIAKECLKYILEIYERFHKVINDQSFNYFIEKFKSLSTQNDSLIPLLYDYRISQRFNYNNIELITKNYKQSKNQLEAIKTPLYAIKRDLTHFIHHQNFTKNLDSANYYLRRAERQLMNADGYFEKERNIAALISRGSLFIEGGEYERGIDALKKAQILNDNQDYIFKILDKFIYYKLYLAYDELNDELQSIKSYNKFLLVEQVSEQAKNLQVVSEYENKFQVIQKDKEILIKDAQRKKNLNIALSLGGFLLLGSIIAILVYRNTKRKQHIAEQAQELEIQRTEKILKEKEIETINAMVSGQEKERHRLAGELHDNLGSTLATVRMQVENLERNLDKVDNPKALLTKTHKLINEAYEKVRTISHERNAGVLAKDGLLPAIQRLANTISSDDGLSIEVEDFGLEQRLSNDLEITIFRIVQELVTNIVKHAKATEATISLTQHEGELNILIEDNGKGFKVGTLQTKNGMGLGSIERRVEHLEGSMSVDSTPGKGTHIIIDIPL